MAWIETNSARSMSPGRNVATREGGVDRNVQIANTPQRVVESPPARVAWIETSLICPSDMSQVVATREGGVDRNIPSNVSASSNHVMVATREGGVDRN